jgi:multidrug efflux pump subunit AcrA (membrane-fusion protein)
MWTILLSALLLSPLLLSPRVFALQIAPPAPAQAAVPPVRTEKLTDAERKQWSEAKAAVADAQSRLDQARLDQARAAAEKTPSPAAKAAEDDAQARLDQANRELQGAEDGISLAHHANTECGCYVQSQGRDFDRVEIRDDTIVIRHVHEAPPSLH